MTLGDTVYPILDGKEHASGTGDFDVLNPATGETICKESSCDDAGVADIVASSRRAFESAEWQALTAAERGNMLLKLADLVDERAEELVEQELLDTGKPVTQLRAGELPLTSAIIRFYAGAADKVEGSVKSGSPDELLLQLYEPYGVVAGILPWNYPFVNAAVKAAPSIATGNAIVLKPSQETPLGTVAFAKLCADAGVPPGIVNVVLGSGSTAGQALIAHPDVKKISFTGSTSVGQHIQRTASEQMKVVNLECGGKNAIIVFADADLDRAAEAALLSAFVNAGQLCVSCSRLLVEESIADDFEAMLVERAGKIKLGDPRKEDTLAGPMITKDQYEIALRYLDGVNGNGCKVLCGGGKLELAAPLDGGFWLEPTVLSNVKPGMAVHDEEIFGPVLSSTRFSSEAEAIAIANGVPYGLSGSVWTRDGSRGLRVSKALDTGITWVNTMLSGYPQISVPPHKMSGTGVELGVEGMMAYLKRKSIVIGHNDDAPVGWGLG
jgi:acyl-CoA reductase-like NAD-dependent aldehyde dehydrogenase